MNAAAIPIPSNKPESLAPLIDLASPDEEKRSTNDEPDFVVTKYPSTNDDTENQSSNLEAKKETTFKPAYAYFVLFIVLVCRIIV